MKPVEIVLRRGRGMRAKGGDKSNVDILCVSYIHVTYVLHIF
jgi:hypothetical protein